MASRLKEVFTKTPKISEGERKKIAAMMEPSSIAKKRMAEIERREEKRREAERKYAAKMKKTKAYKEAEAYREARLKSAEPSAQVSELRTSLRNLRQRVKSADNQMLLVEAKQMAGEATQSDVDNARTAKQRVEREYQEIQRELRTVEAVVPIRERQEKEALEAVKAKRQEDLQPEVGKLWKALETVLELDEATRKKRQEWGFAIGYVRYGLGSPELSKSARQEIEAHLRRIENMGFTKASR